MLTPEYLQSVPDAMVELYAQAEADILADMARRINGFDMFIPSAQYQMQMLEEMGVLRSDIVRELSRLTGKSKKELITIMREAGMETLAADEAIYRGGAFLLPGRCFVCCAGGLGRWSEKDGRPLYQPHQDHGQHRHQAI